MRWAADTLSNYVAYGTAVTNVTPNTANGGVHSLTVHLRKADGREAWITTRNLAVAVGGTPRWPEWLDRQSCTGVFHSSEFIQALKAKYPDALSPYRFVVMGAGQSSAEMFRHLYASYPNAVVTLVIAGFALRPADDSEFVNEIFDPAMVDVFYRSPDCQREKLLDEYANTNYAVADPGLISAIYRDMYLGRRMTGRLRLIPGHRLVEVEPHGSASRLTLRSAADGRKSTVDADGVFFGMGYKSHGSRASSAILRRILSAMKRTILTLDATIQFDARGLISKTAGLPPEAHRGQSRPHVHLSFSVLPFRADDILSSIMSQCDGRDRSVATSSSNGPASPEVYAESKLGAVDQC